MTLNCAICHCDYSVIRSDIDLHEALEYEYYTAKCPKCGFKAVLTDDEVRAIDAKV